MSTNDIATKQNSPNLLRLLRARRIIYWRAKRYQVMLIAVTVLLPLVGAFTSAFAPDARPWIATFAVLFGGFEVSFLDRWFKDRLKNAAKLQEDFDTQLLTMPWNEFVVGPKVDPEDVFSDSNKPLPPEQEAKIRDWYPKVVEQLPIHLARVLCQRENLKYDSRLRLSYGRTLIACLVLFIVAAASIALLLDVKWSALFLGVLVPASPGLNWVLREYKRQADTVELVNRLKAESEKLWQAALHGASASELAVGSRELQDAIYNHRVTSPLVIECLYDQKRAELEAAMLHGADQLVLEYQASVRS